MARTAPQPPSTAFLEDLKQFHFSNGLPFKTPVFNRQKMDLLLLWKAVQERGGSAKVCKAKHWAAVGRVFNPPKSMTNLSFHVKRIYARCLLEYERWLHPELAMLDDVESSGPFSNKRFKDEHIFYGPTLVTKNKRQRARGRSGSAHSGEIVTDGQGTNSSNFQVRASPRRHSSRIFGNLGTEATRIHLDDNCSAPWLELETEQAAVMLWSLKRAEIKRLQGVDKVEKASSAEICAKVGGSEETSPEQVSVDCDAQHDSGDIATNCLEEWYQDKMKQMKEEHEEDIQSLKTELDSLRRLAKSYEMALEKTESAFQECRWCYNKLLEAIYPKHSDDRLLSKVAG